MNYLTEWNESPYFASLATMAKLLSTEELQHVLRELPEWGGSQTGLQRQYVCRDFKDALAWMVQIGCYAEVHNHHPEIRNVYNRVTLELCTHDAGNRVTDRDVALARDLEHAWRLRTQP
jgi:4a-hydroxytetrahydrobiopterin dehydratase